MADVAPAEAPATTTEPIIDVRGLHKWYSGVHALKGIDLAIPRGQVLGLVGDNGAGKSTLINILSGVQQPDDGEVFVEGKRVLIRSPADAMRLGIETIYQYNALVPSMTIARNLFLGREPLSFSFLGIGVMNRAQMAKESVQSIADVDLHLRSPEALVGELSGGQRQGVAIARAMHFRSKVMILDEPTNHLSVKETNKVLGFIRTLGEQGVTSIFISHNIAHVLECCDRVVAMARGEILLDKRRDATDIEEVHAKL